MLIRSQDREILTNMNLVTDLLVEERLRGACKIKAFYPNEDCDQVSYICLAEYSSKEKAIKVLDMIEEMYKSHVFSEGGAMLTRDLYAPAFAFIPPKVFHMPTDEDVEV